MQELIVLLACLNGDGCNETSTTYTHYNKHILYYVDAAEANARNMAGPFVIDYVLPIVLTTVNKQAQIKVSEHLIIGYKDNTGMLTIVGGF